MCNDRSISLDFKGILRLSPQNDRLFFHVILRELATEESCCVFMRFFGLCPQNDVPCFLGILRALPRDDRLLLFSMFGLIIKSPRARIEERGF